MKNAPLLLLIVISFLPSLIKAQTCGTTNIALNKQVNVSNIADEWHPGTQAVDGNLATPWFATGENNHIYVNLTQSYNVCKIRITWSSNGRGKDYKAQVSNDAINWTDIFTRTNNTAVTDEFTVTGTGSYVRILITAKVNSWSGLEMHELEIFNASNNTPPTVSLTAPANNATFTAGSNISLTANANDADGTITKVEYFQGTTKLGETTTTPHTYQWTNVPAGSYALTAKATDNGTAATTSTAVNITVNAASSPSWSLTGNSGTTAGTNFLGTTDNISLQFKTNNATRMTILNDGYVGIGTLVKPNAEAKLGVNGPVYATKLKITQTGWADYVFGKNYKLPTLREVEEYIRKHHHLPGVPAAADVVGKPVDVGDMQEVLLKKIEELTLYIIEQQKQIEELKKKIKD